MEVETFQQVSFFQACYYNKTYKTDTITKHCGKMVTDFKMKLLRPDKIEGVAELQDSDILSAHVSFHHQLWLLTVVVFELTGFQVGGTVLICIFSHLKG